MERKQKNIETPSEKVTWLADQIISAFPQECNGLRLYNLDCGCIYYQRVFRDGELDPQIGIYRDADNGLCDVCMHLEKAWKERVVDEVTVYKTKLQISVADKPGIKYT